jgi:isochorismate pyruvate lyase
MTLDARVCLSIIDVRREIDRVDREIVALLAERILYIERAGQMKSDRNEIFDEARIVDILAKVREEGERHRLNPVIVDTLWREIMRLCIAHEYNVFDSRLS